LTRENENQKLEELLVKIVQILDSEMNFQKPHKCSQQQIDTIKDSLTEARQSSVGGFLEKLSELTKKVFQMKISQKRESNSRSLKKKLESMIAKHRRLWKLSTKCPTDRLSLLK
jgi:hypothetical protein